MFAYMGTLIFVGWTISALIVPRLADLYGRKWTFVVNTLVQLAALVTIIYSTSYTVVCCALFMIGACSSGRWTVSYVYLMEFLTEKNIKGIGPFFNASAGISFVVASLIL